MARTIYTMLQGSDEGWRDDDPLWEEGAYEEWLSIADAVLALLPATDRAVAALSEIRDQAKAFDVEACNLYGGDSPQALWAYGLREFVENALDGRATVKPDEEAS
ncbi:hypothetical protein [Luteimicrobium album]|uniref:hypothetical protein n=1 Tax=Luteimicrobium album TaxID=1054550 RepID=UPI0024E06F5E|nr:hypothetical protein [Luteimicrobium album]